MIYDKIKERELVSPSLSQILFGREDWEVENTFYYVKNYLNVMYNVSLLYTALVQAYILGRSIKNGLLLSSDECPSDVAALINDIWSLQKPADITDTEKKIRTFSFLYNSTALVHNESMRMKSCSIISTINTKYRKYIGDGREQNLVNADDLLDFLQTLSLLRTTDLDTSTMRFIFRPNDEVGNTETFELDCRPFLITRIVDSEDPEEEPQENIYITSRVEKGEKNGELIFHSTLLNCPDNKVRMRSDRRQISQNECMHMICKTLKLDTEWYPVEQCWCDLVFIKRLADVSEKVIYRHLNRNPQKNPGLDIKNEFADLFIDEEIRSKVLESVDKRGCIPIEYIDRTLIGLYIKNGVFRTTYALLMDNPDEPKSKELFDLFIGELKNQNMLSSDIDLHIEECNHQIDKHLRILRTLVTNENSVQYTYRSREIKAEWRAFAILKIAGIKSDNLFMDKEAVYSIDDYYDMFRNAVIPAEENLKRVLSLLTSLYGALLNNCTEFDEAKYYGDVQQFRTNNHGKDLAQLYDLFIEIVKKSQGHPCISRYLGREKICSSDRIIALRKEILDAAKAASSPTVVKNLSQKYVFISYAHKDEDQVKKIINLLHEEGIRVYLDQQRFKKGYDWKLTAIQAMDHPDCMGVLAFMSPNSAVSEAVAFEVSHAIYVVNKLRPYLSEENKKTFLQAINIYDIQNMNDQNGFLYAATHTGNQSAIQLSEVFTKTTLSYISQKKESIEELLMDLRNRAGVIHSDYIVEKDYTEKELALANFFAFLKYGDDANDQTRQSIDNYFYGMAADAPSISHCIYPIVASMKETKIKRDNITMLAYEMVGSNQSKSLSSKYILTSKPLLNPDDYYCFPNYRLTSEDCSWMVDPLLISHRRTNKGNSTSD